MPKPTKMPTPPKTEVDKTNPNSQENPKPNSVEMQESTPKNGGQKEEGKKEEGTAGAFHQFIIKLQFPHYFYFNFWIQPFLFLKNFPENVNIIHLKLCISHSDTVN
jgi:hypothetical protein